LADGHVVISSAKPTAWRNAAPTTADAKFAPQIASNTTPKLAVNSLTNQQDKLKLVNLCYRNFQQRTFAYFKHISTFVQDNDNRTTHN
jgi:hypothetical protein